MNPLQVLFQQPWVARLGWTFLHFLWQGTLIAALLWVVRAIPGRASRAELRYVAACLALALMAVAPVTTFVLIGSEGGAGSIGQAVATSQPGSDGTVSSLPLESIWEELSPWLGAAWMLGVICASVRLLGGWLVAARMRKKNLSDALPEWQHTLARLMQRMRINGTVRLCVSAAMDVPAVIGWLRPVILVPASALAGLPAGQLEALLAHELAHVRRHDYFVNLVQSVVEAVLFYHPAVWWVSRQIRAEREHCCDDAAVQATGGDVLFYARALAELEASRPVHRQALAASGGSLRNRIRRLTDARAASHTTPGAGAAWALGALLVVAIVVAAACGTSRAVRAQEPVVNKETIWPDTVKQGDIDIEVRGLGTLTSATAAEVKLAETHAPQVTAGMLAHIGFRNRRDVVTARVRGVRPGVANGLVTADLDVTSPLPNGIPIGEQIDSTITIGNLTNVVYVGRPVFGQSNGTATLFRFDPDGQHATRVKVQFGRASVNRIVVESGLQPGDKVILSDMSAYEGYNRIAVQ